MRLARLALTERLLSRGPRNESGLRALFDRLADAVEHPKEVVDDEWLRDTRALGSSLEHAKTSMRAARVPCPWLTEAQSDDAREREEIVAFRLAAQGQGRVLALVDEHLLPGVCERFGRVSPTRAKELMHAPSDSLLSDVAIPVTSAVLFSGGAYLARTRAPLAFAAMVGVPLVIGGGVFALWAGARHLLSPIDMAVMRID